MPWNRAKLALIAAVASAALITACGGGEAGESAPDLAEEPGRTPAASQPGSASSLCLVCHSQSGVTVEAAFGTQRQLDAVVPDGFYTSVHGDLPCVECHEDQSSLPHQTFTADGEPIVAQRDSSAVCRSCHAGAAERFLDSVHGTVIKLGDARAPGCTDCHTTHYVRPINTWTATAKAAACVKCHDGAEATFAAALTHREPSPSRLAVDYFATRFFGALVVSVVGIGILHVELDILRWLKSKTNRRNREDK